MSLYRHDKILNVTLFIAGIGYCIDVFDLFLYNMLRVPSLTEMGLEGDAVVKTGLQILSWQVAGMCLGGFLWGVMGDRLGRKRALLGSIILYSLGSFGCAFVHDPVTYGVLRFLTGMGLAGEMGVGLVMVAEAVPPARRNWSIAIFAVIGISSIVVAGLITQLLPWRACYMLGGGAGLLVLVLRSFLMETGMFEDLRKKTVRRGSFGLFLSSPTLLRRYVCVVLFTMPYFLVVNVLITLAPEFGKASGMMLPVTASTALMIYTGCAMLSEVVAAGVCQLWRSRVKPLWLYLGLNVLCAGAYLTQHEPSQFEFYALCGVMGLCNFWLLIVAVTGEHFGTNMRATATASALNMGRATLIITNAVLLGLRDHGFDLLTATKITAGIVFAVGFLCLFGLEETFERDLDYMEKA